MVAYDLERSLGFLLNDVSRLMRKRFDERARQLGLTRAQWRVLGHLRRYEGISQRALAEIMEIETVTLGRHIDRLQDSGWVERRRDPADRRVWRLFLDVKARPIIDRLNAVSQETREETLEGLNLEQRERLLETLLLMKQNLLNKTGNGEAGDDRDRERDRDLRTTEAVMGSNGD